MGLDAYVKCSCYREGRAAPLPFDPALLVWDEDGYFDIRRGSGMDGAVYDKLSESLYMWEREGCEHRNMHYCWLRVGNWPAVRFLQQALADLDADNFPVLWEYLPDGNDGVLPAGLATAALAELALFRELVTGDTNLFLVDAMTGKAIYNYIGAYNGEFAWNTPARTVIGFDAEGLFIYHRDTNALLFRSLHFYQKISPVFFWSKRPKVFLIDQVTGQKIRIDGPLGGGGGNREFKIEQRDLNPADFRALEPLETLLQASIATGNPIIWC